MTGLTKRASGVLMHISSLYGEYSIGNFGKSAFEFVDFLKDCGFSYWQVLPFCMTDECNSPYKSYSAFGGNPFFIDPEALYTKGLLTKDESDSLKQKTPYSCEFERLKKERLAVLLKASKRVENKKEIERFVAKNKYLEQCCLFMALLSANNNKSWTKWTIDTPDDDILFMWKFIQFEFFREWKAIKEYANKNGIKIIGDIPIYVSFDSADVWGNREQFLLDDDYSPSSVAGVPPDYFSKDGQLWGNPLYNWEVMEKDGFSFWKARLKMMFNLFDGIRIDHFRGIESFWSVPKGAKTAAEGKWVKGPGKKFVDMAKRVAKDKLLIAEDLGDITPEVHSLVQYSGFPGMRVLQFGFLSDNDSIHRPHNYPENCIAYTGTHDNNTLLGYVWEQDKDMRDKMLEYFGYTDENWDNCYDHIIRFLFASHANTVILPIQDLLKFGADTRLNIPGKADGNWSYRITKEQLNKIDKAHYKRLNALYNR